MIVSISQPAYLPWLGYFDRIASELHVEPDHVQFEKRSFTSRNKILSANGPLWLSVPVKTKGLYQQVTIENLEIDNSTDWRSNHWKNIKQAYSKAPYFKALANEVEGIYSRRWQSLNELCSFSNEIFRRQLGIDRAILRSSKMQARSTKGELILDLSKECGATTYISGPFGREYLSPEIFAEAKVNVLFHDYKHPRYKQLTQTDRHKSDGETDNGFKFHPYMSIIDLLFNAGPESLRILRSEESLNSNWQQTISVS
ncbi:MAG: WbqC family protein [Candidatus Obscuribacter sp.]|nr:WbqC family protein [Candidatus Obscuribacter sp.]